MLFYGLEESRRYLNRYRKFKTIMTKRIFFIQNVVHLGKEMK